MSVFVHAQGIKTVHAGGGGVKKWQNSVHVVVECPLNFNSKTHGKVAWMVLFYGCVMDVLSNSFEKFSHHI